jgi:hypothetical protein
MTSAFGAAGINFTSELPPDGGANDANNVAFLFFHEVAASVGPGGNFTVAEAATTPSRLTTFPSSSKAFQCLRPRLRA